MKHLLISLALCFALGGAANAQIITEKGSQSDQTLIKLKKIDLMVHILPLLLKKDQLETIAGGIETALKRQARVLSEEDEQMAALDPSVTTALNDAVEKGAYPSRDLQTDIANKTKAMTKHREEVFAQMIADVSDAVVKAKLDAGQMKNIYNSFDPRFINGLMPTTVTDAQKLKFYIRNVLLDPLTAPLMRDMLKKMS